MEQATIIISKDDGTIHLDIHADGGKCKHITERVIAALHDAGVTTEILNTEDQSDTKGMKVKLCG